MDSNEESPLREPVTHFGLWDKADISGGRLYHRAEVVQGSITIDLPFSLIHHGEFSKADELKLRDVLGELSKLLKFWVLFGDIEQSPIDDEDMEDGHEMTISIGTSEKRRRELEVGLVTVVGDGKTAKEMLQMAEIGAREAVTREMMLRVESEELIRNTKVFEGPVWLRQVEGGVEGV